MIVKMLTQKKFIIFFNLCCIMNLLHAFDCVDKDKDGCECKKLGAYHYQIYCPNNSTRKAVLGSEIYEVHYRQLLVPLSNSDLTIYPELSYINLAWKNLGNVSVNLLQGNQNYHIKTLLL